MFVGPIIFLSTFVLFISFLAFFMASKTTGLTALFGRLLGIWLLLVAAVGVGAVVTAPMMGGKPYGMDMPMMRGDGMRCCTAAQPEEPAAPPAPAPAAPEPAAPGPAAPPAEAPADTPAAPKPGE
jgi:hypothetical protein